MSLAYPEDSSQDCLIENSYSSSYPIACIHRRRERATFAGMQGWAGRIPPLAVLLSYTLENGLPIQAERDRGIFESVTRKPTCVAILWVSLGTQPLFLPRAGTPRLLAILQPALCLAGSGNFSGRTCFLRREIRFPLGEHGSASDIGSCARFWRTSPGNNLGRKKAQVTIRRSS